MPSGAIEQQHGVGALRDMARDFVEVELHHVGVGIGQRERGSDAARRTDRAEQIGVLVALVGGLYLAVVPRLAHWRTWPFFWPMRASSLHEDSPVKQQTAASRTSAIRSISAEDWTGIVRIAANAA